MSTQLCWSSKSKQMKLNKASDSRNIAVKNSISIGVLFNVCNEVIPVKQSETDINTGINMGTGMPPNISQVRLKTLLV